MNGQKLRLPMSSNFSTTCESLSLPQIENQVHIRTMELTDSKTASTILYLTNRSFSWRKMEEILEIQNALLRTR